MNILKYIVPLFFSFFSSFALASSIWGKIKNAFNDCSYSSQDYETTVATEQMNTPRLQEHFSGSFSESDFTDMPWMRDFLYVIVVNKAESGPHAQMMRVYENGNLLMSVGISTGRENFELRRKNPVCTGAPARSYWSQTPTGFYTPKYLNAQHTSSSWDSEMPFSIFFDIDNGLALHQVHPKYEKYLGQRASGGCIRQDPATAEELFNRVLETKGSTVPLVQVDGTLVLDQNGYVKYSSRQEWRNPRTGETLELDNYGALIIVENVTHN
jgi:hypothetical protein